MRIWKGYWILVEVENTLLNEDPIVAYIYERMWRRASELGKTITFPRLLAMREALIREKRRGPPFSILGTRLLGKDNWNAIWIDIVKDLKRNYMKKVKGLEMMISNFKEINSNKKLKCAIIARQPKSFADIIYDMRIKTLFKSISISDSSWLVSPETTDIIQLMKKLNTDVKRTLVITSRGGEYISELYSTGVKIIMFKPKISSKEWFPKSDNPYGKAYLDSLQRSDSLEIEEEKKIKNVIAIVTDIKKLPFVITKITEQ